MWVLCTVSSLEDCTIEFDVLLDFLEKKSHLEYFNRLKKDCM